MEVVSFRDKEVSVLMPKAKVVGRHIYGDLIDCANEELLKDSGGLEKLVADAAAVGNMTLLDVKSWKIGLGVSVVAIVLESHISIHTWPEYRYATVDVYSCGAHTNPQAAFEYIVKALKPKRVRMGKVDRILE